MKWRRILNKNITNNSECANDECLNEKCAEITKLQTINMSDIDEKIKEIGHKTCALRTGRHNILNSSTTLVISYLMQNKKCTQSIKQKEKKKKNI